MRADRRNPIIKELRRFKPAKFLITLRDGTTKEAPLSTKANKWEIFDELIERLPWAAIEAQSTDGQTLGVVESDEEPDEDDVQIDGADIFERMAKIACDTVLRAVTATQQETRKMFTDAMRGNAEALTNLVESQRAMQDGYQVALKVASMTRVSDGAPDGGDPVMEMMKMAMMVQAGKPPSPPAPMQKPKVVNGNPVAK